VPDDHIAEKPLLILMVIADARISAKDVLHQ
jgi:hypothetical protein